MCCVLLYLWRVLELFVPEPAEWLGHFCPPPRSLHSWSPLGCDHGPEIWHEWRGCPPRAALKNQQITGTLVWVKTWEKIFIVTILAKSIKCSKWKGMSQGQLRILFTFRAWSEDCPLDGVGLEASLKGVVPQSNYTVLSSSYKSLQTQYIGPF